MISDSYEYQNEKVSSAGFVRFALCLPAFCRHVVWARLDLGRFRYCGFVDVASGLERSPGSGLQLRLIFVASEWSI